MNDIQIPIVHTWRDYSFFFNGEFDIDTSGIGSMIVCNRYALQEILEIRHLKGMTKNEWGEVIHWIKSNDGEWLSQHLGQATEEQVTNDYQV